MKASKYNFFYYFIVISVVLIASVIGSFSHFIIDYAVSVGSGAMDHPRSLTVVLDAGHGGEDGGAVGHDGTLEKDLNLILCYQIRDILNSQGINVVMTREEDRLLYKDSENIKGRRKQYDLRNRVNIAKECDDALFVSIHMNKFPEEKYSGLQVYYSRNNKDSKNIAQSIQSATARYLQSDNSRQIKESTGNIYLLDMLECPAVLIECGFLSNPNECAQLNSEEYRKKLALIISISLIENMY